MTIAWPQQELFNFWRNLDNLPLFVRGLESVEPMGDGTTRWRFRGPGGVPLHWHAEVINQVEPELIAWRSLPGADVVSAGSVHFRALTRGGTEVTVSMQYAPPGGKAAAAMAWIAGRAPAAEVREDLRRLKQLFEAGEIPTADQQPAGKRSLFFSATKRVAS